MQTEIPTASLPTRAAAQTANRPSALTGARYVVAELDRRGVQIVAGIPGGPILPLYDALYDSPIRHVLCRHEQAAAFVAQGMARSTGRAGVCLATSGPGATNLVTALADALADSVPLVAITAQVPRSLIGTNAFQEVDTCSIARPVTKACFFADDVASLPTIIDDAFRLAEQGRPGPVLIDVPKDVFMARLGEGAAGTSRRSPPAETARAGRALPPRAARVAHRLDADSPATWQGIAAELDRSQRPLLFVGGGVRWADAESALGRLAVRIDAGVVCTLHGLGAFPAGDPRMLGMLGMHGHAAANRATEEADLVLAIGVRFDDRATGNPSRFCRNARIVHVDVDPTELGKIKPVDVGVVADARLALERLLDHASPRQRPDWQRRLRELGRGTHAPDDAAIDLLGRLQTVLRPDAVVTTDVGQHQMWVAQHLQLSRPQRLLTSGGLGTMGFGLPAAIGAALAHPGRQVVCVTGDGSLWMNLQELATLAELGLDVFLMVLNNAELGMVRQQQSFFYDQRHAASHFGRASDFAALARAFGIAADSATPRDVGQARLGEMVNRREPRLLDVRLESPRDVLPMVPPGGDNLEMILRSPLDTRV